MMWQATGRLSGLLLTLAGGLILASPAFAQYERELAGIRLNSSAATVLRKYGNPNEVIIGELGVAGGLAANQGAGQGGFAGGGGYGGGFGGGRGGAVGGFPGAPGGGLPGFAAGGPTGVARGLGGAVGGGLGAGGFGGGAPSFSGGPGAGSFSPGGFGGGAQGFGGAGRFGGGQTLGGGGRFGGGQTFGGGRGDDDDGGGGGFPGVPGGQFGAGGRGGLGAGGGIGQFGPTISTLAPQQEVTWIYYRKVNNNQIAYEFLIGPNGQVVQIRVSGYSGGNARTRRNITLGSTYREVVRQYGYPEEHYQVGRILVCSYKKKAHAQFQFLNERGTANPLSGGNKVVAITIATVE